MSKKEKIDVQIALVKRWVIEKVGAEVERRIQRIARLPGIVHIAVMPDVHPAGDYCVGLSIATRNVIYPMAVGADIGCGMAVAAFHGEAAAIEAAGVGEKLLNAMRDAVPVMLHPQGQRATTPLLDDLQEGALSSPQLQRVLRRDGAAQFGTLGRGNHFVEFQSDEDGRLWIMLHSGSRAMGQAIHDWHVASNDLEKRGSMCFRADDPRAAAYLSDVEWARKYAAGSRLAMIESASRVIRNIIGFELDSASIINCDHNHVSKELHFGEWLWVHRKGASPALEGQVGIIPGSMGTHSFHTVGRGHPDSLRSSSHGAGRRMTREQAARRIAASDLDQQMAGIVYDRRRARQLLAEAPEAYNDIDKVMRAQRELTRVLRKVRPALVYKGC